MVGRFCGFAMNFIFINSCTLGLRKWSIDSLILPCGSFRMNLASRDLDAEFM